MPLSPFIAAQTDPSLAGMRALLALPAALGARLALERRGAHWAVAIEWASAGGLHLVDVTRAGATARRWASAGAFDLSYRSSAPYRDPFERPETREVAEAIRRRLGAAPAAAQATLELLERLEAALPFAGRRDRDIAEIVEAAGARTLLVRLLPDPEGRLHGAAWPPFARFVAWMDEAAREGVASVALAEGSESSPHLEDAVAHAQALFRDVVIQTTGPLLRDAARAEALRARGWRQLHVLARGLVVRGAPATRRDAPGWIPVEPLDAHLEAGGRLSLRFELDEEAPAHLGDDVALALGRWARHRDRLGLGFGYFGNDPTRWRFAPLDEAAPAFAAACRLAHAAGVRASWWGEAGVPPCALADVRGEAAWPALEGPELPREAAPGFAYVEACGACAGRPRCHGLSRDYVERHGARGARALEPH